LSLAQLTDSESKKAPAATAPKSKKSDEPQKADEPPQLLEPPAAEAEEA
jgi:hypothetical protein